MDYRLIQDDEKDKVVHIRNYCFRHAYSGKKLEDFLHWFQVSKAIGAFDGTKLAGQLMVLPLEMTIHGKQFHMGGISFVATYPEYRNSGIMKQLVMRSLEEMKQQEQIVSILGPFSVSFYRHFGWDLFFDKLKYNISAEQLNTHKKAVGSISRFSYTEGREQLKLVKEIYHIYALKTNGMMIRTDDWWSRLELREPEAFFVISKDELGKPQGFMRYAIKDRTFEVLDSITLNLAAERVLWNFIEVHRSSLDEVIGEAAAFQSFGSQWSEPQFKKEVIQDIMIRIVDVEKFLTVYPFKNRTKTLYLNVTDTYAPWNQGIYVIDSNGVKKLKENSLSVECLEMDISSLSSYLAGYHELDWYRGQEKAKGSERVLKDWNQAIPKEQPQFYGHF
ncbi:GNAT family N-acetyltransferase [Carnobacterium sp. CS13]|uniref:GNAT family N-acetyltransferase n=1 Tax=Carnobacterium sp. CS13 TaxID=2800128 RepID=UPI0019124F75|nr:GNAT family N-acetyltransferase [Carnobacterium sp. CS13]QQP69505.1 GNAT family N-acetyltransferase [Carnobacterium sp. CS13]